MNNHHHDNDTGATGGVMVQVDAETLGDLRTFPERVYDMVMIEDQEDHDLILWENGEEGRSQFAMFRNDPRIPTILERHIGNGDPRDFEMRLCKHGWKPVKSETHPGRNYAAYYHSIFRRGMERSNLRDIKRIPKSERVVRRQQQQQQQRHHRPQNPQDASFDGGGSSSSSSSSSTSGEFSDNDPDLVGGGGGGDSSRRNDRELQSQLNNSNNSSSSNSTSIQHGGGGGGRDDHNGDTQMSQDVIELLSDDDDDDENNDHVEEASDSLADHGQQQETMPSAVDDDDGENRGAAGHLREEGQPPENESQGRGQRNDDMEEDKELEPMDSDNGDSSEIPQPAANAGNDSNNNEQAKGNNVAGDQDIIELSDDDDEEEEERVSVIELEDDDSDIEVVLTVPAPSHRRQPTSPSTQATDEQQTTTGSPDGAADPKQSSPEPSLDSETRDSFSSSKAGGDGSPAAKKGTISPHATRATAGQAATNLQEMDADPTTTVALSGSRNRLQNVASPACSVGESVFGMKPDAVNKKMAIQSPGFISKKPQGLTIPVLYAGSATDGNANAEGVRVGDKALAGDASKELNKDSTIYIEKDAGATNLKDGQSTAKATDTVLHLRMPGNFSGAETEGDRSNFNRDQEMVSIAANEVNVAEQQGGSRKQAEDIELLQLFKQTWKKAQQDCESNSEELLKKKLLEKRNKVIGVATNRKRSFHAKPRVFQDRLSSKSPSLSMSHNQTQQSNVWMTVSQNGTQTKLISVRLDGADPPQPRHNSPVSLSQLQFIEDQTELSHVPYFCDDEEKLEEILNNFYTTEERTKRLMRGAIYEEENMNTVLDCFLQHLLEKLCQRDARGKFNEAAVDRVRLRITDLVMEEANVDADWLKERFDLLKGPKPEEDSIEEVEVEELCSEYAEWKDYANKIDTYRGMLCTRCFTYNCTFHGTGDEEKPCLMLQYEKGLQRVDDGYWESVEFLPKVPTSRRLETTPSRSLVTRLSEEQEALCQRMFAIFQGDAGKIAAAVRAPTELVSDFIISKGLEVPGRSLIAKRPSSRKKYTSMTNYNKAWLDNINSVVDHPWCMPCSHTEPCSESTCSCVQNAFFCTKACGHAEYSPNFFRGCECKSICNTNSCACFAANRECDPDLCKTCGACCDPPNTYEKVNQKCHNDNMSMRRHRRLLIGKSTVAGWGLFTKDPLKKGDFIHEYVGELISHDESERRGHLYDLAKLSYLFDQSTDYAVDATLKGNKVRFGNHSDTPNVDTKKMFVNGNVRIGFFANQNIEAQSELFINYSGTFTSRGTFMKDMKAAPLEES